MDALRAELPDLACYVRIGAPPAVPGDVPWSEVLSESAAAPAPVLNPAEHLAAIIYTSGTTGQPKGAMLTHANLAANTASIREALDMEHGRDIVLTVLPMFHAFAATAGTLAPLFSGCTVVPVPRFSPELVVQTIEASRASLFMGVPSMYSTLLKLPDEFTPRLASLRYCISGAAAMPVELMRRFEARFGKLIYEGDGPTECSPVTCCNPIGGVRKPASVGLPVPGVEMEIRDEEGRQVPTGDIGEICVRGPNVMKGYWNRPEDTREAFFGEWFRTGDIGHADEDGYFFIVDRKKDMIIVNGMNVYPRVIEEVLYRFAAVREAAVVGQPHELHGEIPVAYVALHADQDASAADIRAHCREYLGRHEVPRQVLFLDELPKNAAGKIVKRELRKQGEVERGVNEPGEDTP